ncbi:hypothetical protein DFH27DRAFT_607629 [Peziza echinospora]|nr:hypothetical protein DFH27DRAFT_607629 [Peziza echinospora]
MADSMKYNIARSSTIIFATQLDRFQNLAAFDNGAQILNEIRLLRIHLDARLNNLDGCLDARLMRRSGNEYRDYSIIARLVEESDDEEHHTETPMKVRPQRAQARDDSPPPPIAPRQRNTKSDQAQNRRSTKTPRTDYPPAMPASRKARNRQNQPVTTTHLDKDGSPYTFGIWGLMDLGGNLVKGKEGAMKDGFFYMIWRGKTDAHSTVIATMEYGYQWLGSSAKTSQKLNSKTKAKGGAENETSTRLRIQSGKKLRGSGPNPPPHPPRNLLLENNPTWSSQRLPVLQRDVVVG